MITICALFCFLPQAQWDAQLTAGRSCQLEGSDWRNQVTLVPLDPGVSLFADFVHEVAAKVSDEDQLDQVINATCRVTVAGRCGSGTIVGKDAGGAAIILTNAHVAGTRKGRVCNVERWDQLGNRYRGQASIIAAGYGRDAPVDFALLRVNGDFGRDVKPVPIADRLPKGRVTNHGSPRCEWPSMQTLKMVKGKGQILKWMPEAISGRSGSSLIDYNDSGPRVVGLLTWGGQGLGLGQSAPFLLDAIRGRLPKNYEPLPPGVTEVSCQSGLVDQITADEPPASVVKPQAPTTQVPDKRQRDAPVKSSDIAAQLDQIVSYHQTNRRVEQVCAILLVIFMLLFLGAKIVGFASKFVSFKSPIEINRE